MVYAIHTVLQNHAVFTIIGFEEPERNKPSVLF